MTYTPRPQEALQLLPSLSLNVLSPYKEDQFNLFENETLCGERGPAIPIFPDELSSQPMHKLMQLCE